MSTHLDQRPVKTTAAKGYLHQLDFVRTITFLGVIFVHTLLSTNDQVNGTVTNALALNMHFTRNTFFALTGLVLAYGMLGKAESFRVVPFWRKRVPVVVVPFVIWAFAYWVYFKAVGGDLGQVPHRFGEFLNHLAWGGTDGYQLYFIFVTIQIYLLFPVMFWIARKTRGRHLALLAASAALELGVYALMTYYQPTNWFGETVMPHLYATLLPYQFFVMLGIVAAFHRERIEAALLRDWPLVFGGTAIMVAIGQLLYQLRMHDGAAPWIAARIYEPSALPLYLSLTVTVYTVGLLLARHRNALPLITRFAAYGTKRSFGVFLVHVMVLSTLLLPKSGQQPWLATLPGPIGTLVTYLLTVVITLGVVELLSRAPKAQWWVGRARKPKPVRSTVPGDSRRELAAHHHPAGK
jgi:peptidoglycan/LPS O-acetylase OafA/YrhL